MVTEPSETNTTATLDSGLLLRDAGSISRYGADAQRTVASVAEKTSHVGGESRSGKTDRLLSQLCAELKSANASAEGRGGFFGRFGDATTRYQRAYRKASDAMKAALDQLDANKISLLAENRMLERAKEQSAEAGEKLSGCIAAGEAELERLRADTSAERAALAQQLERRLHDLRISEALCMQTGATIDLLHRTNVSLIERTNALKDVTVPVWHQSMAIALGMERAQQTAAFNKRVGETARQLSHTNARVLRHTDGLASEIDEEAIRQANDDLLAALNTMAQEPQE